jgi:hypothetical protein
MPIALSRGHAFGLIYLKPLVITNCAQIKLNSDVQQCYRHVRYHFFSCDGTALANFADCNDDFMAATFPRVSIAGCCDIAELYSST